MGELGVGEPLGSNVDVDIGEAATLNEPSSSLGEAMRLNEPDSRLATVWGEPSTGKEPDAGRPVVATMRGEDSAADPRNPESRLDGFVANESRLGGFVTFESSLSEFVTICGEASTMSPKDPLAEFDAAAAELST